MKCPNCNETLVMAERQGVEIDYCPQCRGIWLDKGELDKVVERSADFSPNATAPRYQESEYKKQYTPEGYRDPHYKHKKRKGFLGDFFDFD